MNLLLLLSALLTALSGAQGSARSAQMPVTVSRTAEVAGRVQARHVAPGVRPVARLPHLGVVAAVGDHAAWHLAPAVPLFLSRRRE